MSGPFRVPGPGASWPVDTVQALKELQQIPFLQGVWLENVDLTTTTTTVPHKLGRAPRGYFVMAKTGPGDVWLSQAPDSRNLYVLADSTLTVDLWVF